MPACWSVRTVSAARVWFTGGAFLPSLPGVEGCACREPRPASALEARGAMNPFEYLLLFAAIVLGLAISDLAISLHRLLNAAGRVRWGLLSPLAGIIAFLKIITQWWTW